MSESRDAVKEKVVDLIYKSGRAVTAGDLAQNVGLPMAQASVLLNNLASQSRGQILVDKSGNVAYKFRVGFERSTRPGLLAALTSIWRAVCGALFFASKALFGLALFFSTLLLVVPFLITAALVTLKDIIFAWPEVSPSSGLFDFRNWRRLLCASEDEGSADQTQGRKRRSKRFAPIREHNILLDCYSFVFGDGDPNLDLEERKWKSISAEIARNNGVVTPEQIAPFLGKKARDDDMIPVMARFDGSPEVTASGNIVYAFPQLLLSAAKANSQAIGVENERFLRERPRRLWNIPRRSLFLIFAAGLINISESWLITVALFKVVLLLHLPWLVVIYFLECILACFHLWKLEAAPLSWLAIFWGLVLGFLILSYTLFFFCFPLTRLFLVQFHNIGVNFRNWRRARLAMDLDNPTPELAKKLAEAKSLARGSQKFEESNLSFDSSRDSLEQQFD